MANAPFGANINLSKEEYAKTGEELEAAEAKHQNDVEPEKGKFQSEIHMKRPSPDQF